MSCLNPGSVHDATAFACSRFGAWAFSASDELAVRLISEGYCFVGDEAYVASELVAVPWPGRTMDDPWKDGNNFYQSSARIHIEQAFCQLVWRMGIFWRPLKVPVHKRPVVAQTAFKLHNFCRRHDVEGLGHLSDSSDSAVDPRSLIGCCDGVDVATSPRRSRQRSNLRERMTSVVEKQGRRRPPVHTYSN